MADQHKDDTHRITPRDVEPDKKHSGGDASRDRETGHERTLRRDPKVSDTSAGDQAGIAGGGIDSNVSGLGGDKDRV